MAKNEDGEFELILGNRQLLSVFFIVVVLLGGFFTMGYIVGRNSNPVAPAEAVAARKETKPLVIDPPTPRETPRPTPPPAASAPPTETAAQLPPHEEPKPEPPKPEPVKAQAIKAPPPPKLQPVKPLKQAPPPAASSGQPTGGETYLKLVATAK